MLVLPRPITSGTSQLNWLMTLWIALLHELSLGASRELQWFPGGKHCKAVFCNVLHLFLADDFGPWMFASWFTVWQCVVTSNTSKKNNKNMQKTGLIVFVLNIWSIPQAIARFWTTRCSH